MPDSPERTALYRYFDANEGLLYIGISIDPDGRLKVHRDNHAPWVNEVSRRAVEWHGSRPLALKAEAEAIKGAMPWGPIANCRVLGRRPRDVASVQ